MKVNLLFLGLLGVIIIAGSVTEEQKAYKKFEEHYVVSSLQFSDKLEFAGEPFVLSDDDLKERFDRELLTNVYWQSQTVMFIKRAAKFFPTIEKVLAEEGIPADFKYLALAESGLIWSSQSPSGATGYWQFLEGTAKRYKLRVDDEVDERYHLIKSTKAACAYFREAFNEFKSWSLVAASYNMGLEGLKRQLAIQQVKTYADLYLNVETSRYLFRILALKEIIEHSEKYGFNVPLNDRYKSDETYTIQIDTIIPDLAVFALKNQSNYREVKLFNPWIRKNFINVKEKPVFIQMPISHLKRIGVELKDTITTASLKLY